MVSLIGQTVSHYKILQKLGEGGMGVVYKAQDTKLDRPVALKFLPHGLDTREPERSRFLQEARAAAILNHPNICTVHDVQDHEGEQFIVMEYVDGVTLREKIAEGKLQTETSVGYAIQIAEALEEAHSKGIVHRDVKADNIMVTAKNQVKVMDFGLARLKGSLRLTRTSSTVGTLTYMAPEQLRGEESDARSDIFSFGVLLYEMLTGQLPFRGEHEAAVIYAILNEEPDPIEKHLVEAPSDLVHILNRLLEKDPAERYQSMGEVVIELKRLKRDTSRVHRAQVSPGGSELRAAAIQQPAAAPTTSPRVQPSHKRTLVVVVTGLVLVAAAAMLIFFSPFASHRYPAKRVAVLPFENQTGDSSLNPIGRIVEEWIMQSLSQSGLAEVVPRERLLEIEGARNIRSLAKATGAGTFVSGSYYKLGETIQLQAQVTDANDEKVLHTIEPVSGPANNVMEAVETVRQRVLGVLAATLDDRLQGMASQFSRFPKFEAYQYHIQGYDLFMQRDYRGAIDFFRRAGEIDTTFTLPLLYACGAYMNLGQLAQADSLVGIINARRVELAPLEQCILELVKGWLTGDLARSLDAMRQLSRLAPGTLFAYQWGLEACSSNRPRECIEALSTIDPEAPWWRGWPFYWNVLTSAYHMLGEHERELDAALKGRKQYPSFLGTLNCEIRALAALGRIEEVKKCLDESLSFPLQSSTPGASMRIAAEELRAHGHADAALSILDRAIQWYRARPPEEAHKLREGLASTLYDAHRWEEARTLYETLARESPEDMDLQGTLGLLAARQGDREKAIKISEWLLNLKKPYLLGGPTYTRACIAAVLGERDQAAALLRDSFLQGVRMNVSLHTDPDFESLWDYPPFQELMKPKG
jgi:serine/threonine protein kinase/tetratricopeptide (TPR) repeat protein